MTYSTGHITDINEFANNLSFFSTSFLAQGRR